MTATARRGHGEGSVYRDAANGTWVGAISLGWRPDGSRVRRKVTGRTKTEVREKLKKLQVEADAGLKTSASYTVARAVDDWAAEALHTGIALVTGTEDRQWLYPAMTRGTDTNLTYVFTTPAHPADPPLSDSAIRQQNLANADHLAVLHAIWTVLHAIWTAETRGARHDHYRDLVTAALPPGHRQPLSHQARWLYRTLHAAELAGLNPAEVIRTAITSRDLAGARDIAAVLDARIRPCTDPLIPQPQGPWTRIPPRMMASVSEGCPCSMRSSIGTRSPCAPGLRIGPGQRPSRPPGRRGAVDAGHLCAAIRMHLTLRWMDPSDLRCLEDDLGRARGAREHAAPRGLRLTRRLPPASPPRPSCTPAIRRPISRTRSPGTPPRAPPCTPGSRWSPAARTGSGGTRR